jgi:hypothetical protein
MTCALCGRRTAKRACPGVGQDICPVCCGTKRLTEIACPPTCVYLESAQRHPAAAVKRQQDSDLTILMGALGRISERQLELFFLIQTFVTRFKADGGLPVVDADVAEAAGALASTFETAARGVLYEHQAPSAGGEALRRALTTFLAEVGRRVGARFEREAVDVLRGIERGAKHEAPGIGSGSVDYLTLVARILHERPPDARERSSLVLP